MTNNDRKDYYFIQAEKEYEAMNKAWEENDWNRVIRKSQETIELLLKGVLKFMNIEFPKEHDIAKYFEKILVKRKIVYDANLMQEIIKASQELTKKRAPAYYGEEFYPQQDAETAKNWAKLTKKFVQELMKNLT